MPNKDNTDKKKTDPKAKAAVATAIVQQKPTSKPQYSEAEFKAMIPALFGKDDSEFESRVSQGVSMPEGGENTSKVTMLGKGKKYAEKTRDRFDGGKSSVTVYKDDDIKYKSKDIYDKEGKFIRNIVKIKQKSGKYKYKS